MIKHWKLAGLAFASVSQLFFPATSWSQPALPTQCFQIDGTPLTLEVAQTLSEKREGLMYRDALPQGHGMLFVYESARPLAFWMKHCKIALDLLYFRAGRLVHVESNVPPCTDAESPCPVYPSVEPVDTVIELAAGSTLHAGWSLGAVLQPCPGTGSTRVPASYAPIQARRSSP